MRFVIHSAAMDMALGIFFRWLHVIAACVAVGGLFFMAVVLPLGLRAIEPAQHKELRVGLRQVFKRVVHSAILLLIISGAFNTWRNWEVYRLNMPLTHAVWGIHLILALVVFGISLAVVAGKEPRPTHRAWMWVNLVLMILAVAAASTLKSAREKGMIAPSSQSAARNSQS